MNIHDATREYEHWVTLYTPLIPSDLDTKHQQMAADEFSFLRATYYRWAQRWPTVCLKLARAPSVLSVGDLHIENYGTWRDREGRLCWGINDFDEASVLPYAQDLVRLATSAQLAIQTKHLQMRAEDACNAILTGYREALQSGGQAFVLENQHGWLRKIALANLKEPEKFWQKIAALPVITDPVPDSARVALEHLLPERGLKYEVKHRIAGLGSLGRPRYAAVADFEGGKVAREAKALVPSASLWATHSKGPADYLYQAIVDRAVRSHDPYIALQGPWIVRRLAPDNSRIELVALADTASEAKLLHAMGRETANVHLGSEKAISSIQKDLADRGTRWLKTAADAMTEATMEDWNDWRNR